MNNDTVFSGLQPAAVFNCFHDLSMIPRVPGKQRKVSDFIMDYAKSLNLPREQDAALNVIVRKPGAPGYEDASPVVIQAHLDMVCEKDPGVEHDFETEPLRLRVVDGRIMATGTTLGADNGIGVAYMMAILADTTAKHPPLECIFTTDEETDMGGAFGLDFSKIRSRTILNLDAPAVGVCGSGELEVEMRFPRAGDPVVTGSRLYTIRLSGMMGGHTGQNAMAERGNAIVYLNRVLLALGKVMPFQLIEMRGGAGMSSAFARNAECVVAVPEDQSGRLESLVAEQSAIFKSELAKRDPEMVIALTPCDAAAKEALSAKTAATLMNLVCILPDGVFSLNRDFPGAMESCSNVGVVETRENEIFVTILIRSTVTGKKYYLYDKVTRLCDALGIAHAIGRDLPHWEYAVSPELEALLKRIYPGEEFCLSQGTLECGIFCANLAGATVIALGCPYYNAHSPSEYFLISETKVYWDKLLEFLAELK